MKSSEQGTRLAAHLFHLASLCLNIHCTISPDSVVEHIWRCPTVVVVATATTFASKTREHQERTSDTSAKVTVQNGWSVPVAQSHSDFRPNQQSALLALCWLVLACVLRCQLISVVADNEYVCSGTLTCKRALNTWLGCLTRNGLPPERGEEWYRE